MREILFKAIATGAGDWVIGQYAGDIPDAPEHCFIVQTLDDGKMVKIYAWRKTLCQYTGLKDRNGAMIFEGDHLIFTEKRDWIKFDSGNAVFVDSLCSCGCCFDEFHGSGFAIQSSCGFYYATCIDEYWELTGKNIHDK